MMILINMIRFLAGAVCVVTLLLWILCWLRDFERRAERAEKIRAAQRRARMLQLEQTQQIRPYGNRMGGERIAQNSESKMQAASTCRNFNGEDGRYTLYRSA